MTPAVWPVWLLVEYFNGTADCHEVHGDVDQRGVELARPGYVRAVTQVAAPPPGATLFRSPPPKRAPATNLRSADPPLEQLPARRMDRRGWVRRGAR